jgi:hypothetical protein
LSDDEGRTEREERVSATAERLLSVVLDLRELDPPPIGDPLRAVIADIPAEDLRAVLHATLKRLQAMIGAQGLRDGAELDIEANDRPPVPDSALPADPWGDSGDVATNAIERGRQLFEAVVAQGPGRELFRAIGALEESELVAIVLERALAAMIERTRPGP